jgi:hypothetical protein
MKTRCHRADASNLEAFPPPFLHLRILSPLPIEMRPGARVDYALSLGGVPLRWRTRTEVNHDRLRHRGLP